MFQQVVYTRCKPRRELLNVANAQLSDGKVVNQEGLAIHNFSRGLLENETLYDPLLLETLMQKTNAAKEMGTNATGIFSSYEYFYNEKGGSFLGHEYLRPYNASDVRPNGQKHRPGTHIKQYLVGDFSEYPCVFFGSSTWNAHKETENFYYHDNDEPLEFLPEIAGNNDSVIQRSDIKKFIEDGRSEVVKQLVAVVISEMSKPFDDRQFVVIRDFPENVEKWIAAVELSLPVYLAKQISFSTNVVATENLSVDNTYYVDGKGRFIKGNQKEAKETGGKKQYFSMIAGIHPTAQGSSNVTAGMNNSTYVLLDGTTKTIENKLGNSVSRHYYEAVVAMDEDIEDFDKLLEELKQVEFGSSSNDLFELFDGYKYLLDSASNPNTWDYGKVKSFLSIFKKYEIAPFKWSQYLAEKVYGLYSKFYEQDVKEGLSLLKQVIAMDHASKLQSTIESYLVEKYMYEIRTKSLDVAFATTLNKQINMIYSNVPQLIAEGVKESVPTFIDTVGGWGAEQSYYIFTKLFESNNIVGQVNPEWHKDEMNSKLITALFDKICTDDKTSSDLLVYVKNAPLYLEFAVSGANKDFEKWSRFICDSVTDSKLELVCGALLDMETVTDEQYEAFLVMLLKAGKTTSVLFKFVVKATDKFGLKENTSLSFVTAYIDVNLSRPTELKSLVDLMSENDLGEAAEELAFNRISDYIDETSVDNPLKALANEFEKWRLGLKKPAGRAYTIVFVESLGNKFKENVVDVLDRYMTKESLVVTSEDAKLLMDALNDHIKDTEVYVKLYHLLKQKNDKVATDLISVNFEDANSVKWYLDLFLRRPFADWTADYFEDIKEIENKVYQLIKKESIDRVEKMIIKSLENDSADIEMYKNYFERVRLQIKVDKAEEKQKTKEVKKESKKDGSATAEVEDKKNFFSKLFSKK